MDELLLVLLNEGHFEVDISYECVQVACWLHVPNMPALLQHVFHSLRARCQSNKNTLAASCCDDHKAPRYDEPRPSVAGLQPESEKVHAQLLFLLAASRT